MYLHLGDDYSIAVSRIIAILDLSLYKTAQENPFLQEVQKISKKTGKELRSVVVTKEELHFSMISAQSLKKRIESPCYREYPPDFSLRNMEIEVCD